MKKKHIVLVSILLAMASVGIGAGVLSYQHFQTRDARAAGGAVTSKRFMALEQAEKSADKITEITKAKEAERIAAEEAKKEEERKAREAEALKKAEAAKRTVALDPGHQSFAIDMSAKEPNGPGSSEMKAKCTSGTTGKYTGIPEYQLALDISLMLRTELENRGYQVVLTREDNETAISNSERALMAADSGADIYVRIHANGSENTSVSGALALVPSSSNPYVASLAGDSYALAELVLNAYCGQTGFANKGIQLNDTMTGMNWSRVPVMILEMGFMSNESDDFSMADQEFRGRMVTGIADGIEQYFGIS